MKKVYYYKNNVDFEYYWYGDMHIIIQDAEDKFLNLTKYAVVYSEASFKGKENLQYFKNKNLTQIIKLEDFKNALDKAFTIIKENI